MNANAEKIRYCRDPAAPFGLLSVERTTFELDHIEGSRTQAYFAVVSPSAARIVLRPRRIAANSRVLR